MDEHRVLATDREMEEALNAAQALRNEPIARAANFVPQLRLLIVELSNHRRLALPIEDLQGLEAATPEQLAHIELLGSGTGIHFPDLDADFYVPALIEGVYGNRRWMAQLGRKGGKATSAAKRQASRSNGAKGGRPKKAAAAHS